MPGVVCMRSAAQSYVGVIWYKRNQRLFGAVGAWLFFIRSSAEKDCLQSDQIIRPGTGDGGILWSE